MARSAVFLDRDGVLNRAIVRDGKPLPPQTLAEFAILPGVPDALRHLRQAGFALVVVTNQPDVARGTQSRSVVEAINLELTSRLPLDAVQVCYHDDADRCACRKPKPGLLVESAASLGLALETSYMVGDRWRDVEAGRAAGCKTILIDRGYSERGDCTPDHRASDLAEAAEWILRQPRRDSGHQHRGRL
jgi:D-glycero-D-manno-heptose 1,7-bisphosphate phosphatase